MRRRRHQWGPSVLLASFVLSAVVHLSVGFPFRDFVNDYLASAKLSDRPVKVVRLSAEQWAKNRGLAKLRKLPQVETIEDKTSPKVRRYFFDFIFPDFVKRI